MPISVDLDSTGTHIKIDAEWRHKELCKAIPGSKWSQDEKVWRVPLSWSSCLALRSQFKDELVIEPALAAWASTLVSTRIDPANSLRELDSFEDPDNADLYPYQQAGVAFMSTARQALLADEPGLGKSAQTIRALKKLHDSGENVFPILIVCPNTLKKTWDREFHRWWPEVEVVVIKGTAAKRKKLFADIMESDPDRKVAVAINWESVRSHSRLSPYGSVALIRCVACGGEDAKVTPARCEVHVGELNEINFGSVVADEIHRSKNPKSKQTRALWSATGDADIRFALTGTPIANDVVDLWAILHWLSPRDWPSKTKWIDRMIDTQMNAFGGMYVIGVKPHMAAEFYKSINPYMRRMLKKAVLPWLPDVVRERRDVEMSAKQAKAYNQMRDTMIAELEEGEAITAPSVLTQTLRLLQFASSYAEIEIDAHTGEPKVVLSEPSCKVDQFMEDIKNNDFGDDSVAVCAVSRQLIELLSAKMTKAGIEHGLITGAQNEDERQQAVDDFQSGKIKWVLFTVQAGGVGITLTAARRLVRLQRPWSLVDDKQAMDRVLRIGSEIHDSIIVTDYVTDGSVEERVLEVLDTKAGNFEEVVRDRDQLIKLLRDDKAGLL